MGKMGVIDLPREFPSYSIQGEMERLQNPGGRTSYSSDVWGCFFRFGSSVFLFYLPGAKSRVDYGPDRLSTRRLQLQVGPRRNGPLRIYMCTL